MGVAGPPQEGVGRAPGMATFRHSGPVSSSGAATGDTLFAPPPVSLRGCKTGVISEGYTPDPTSKHRVPRVRVARHFGNVADRRNRAGAASYFRPAVPRGSGDNGRVSGEGEGRHH